MAESFPLKGLTLEAAERIMIEQALQDTAGNVSEAARRLGVSRMTLRYRMDKYGYQGLLNRLWHGGCTLGMGAPLRLPLALNFGPGPNTRPLFFLPFQR